MREKSVKAKVCWVKEEAGGRQSPPSGPRYVTVARFDEEKDKWPNEAWSLVVDFRDSPDESLCMIADVRFLMPEAPVEYCTREALLNSLRALKWLQGEKCFD